MDFNPGKAGGVGGAGTGGGDGKRATQSCHPLFTMISSDVHMICPWAVMPSEPSDPQKL